MTINTLLESIPESARDYSVVINIPCVRPGDEGDFPLIQVTIDDVHKSIVLDADV